MTGNLAADLHDAGIPTRLYMGTVADKDGKVLLENNGHLGILDHPKMVDRLWGSFVYNPHPDPMNTSPFGKAL